MALHNEHRVALSGGDAIAGALMSTAAKKKRDTQAVAEMLKVTRTYDLIPFVHGGGHDIHPEVRKMAPDMALIEFQTY